MKRQIVSIIGIILFLFLLISCGPKAPGEAGTEIISAGEALSLIGKENTVLVDAQKVLSYRKGHLAEAVNISRADIVVNKPYPNVLAPVEQITAVIGSRGISNDTLVIIYDNNKNMDAARLWWTLKVLGHDGVRVVSGGLSALREAGAEIVTTAPTIQEAVFSPSSIDESMIASTKEIKDQINNPDDHVVVLDTRTLEEYNAGTIPGSVLIDFVGNNFSDGTYKPVQQVRICYIEEGIDYDDEIIMFCKTSIRGAQTYLALYNAGYRSLKLYDGAWVEWSANPANPIFVPETVEYQIDSSDNS